MSKKVFNWNSCLELLKADVDCDHYQRLAALFYYSNYRCDKNILVRMVDGTCFEVETEFLNSKKTGKLLFEADGFDFCERIIEVNTVKKLIENIKTENPAAAAIITFNELSSEALKLAKNNNIRVVYFHPDEYEKGKEDCLLFGSVYSRFEELSAKLVYDNEKKLLTDKTVASNKELLKVGGKVWPLELYIKNEVSLAKDKSDGKHIIRVAENSTLETLEGSLNVKWIDLKYEIKTSRKCYQIPVEWVCALFDKSWNWDLYIFEDSKNEEISRQLIITDINNLVFEEIHKKIIKKNIN